METSEGLCIFSLLDKPYIMAYFVEEPVFFKNENIANLAIRDVLYFAYYCQQ